MTQNKYILDYTGAMQLQQFVWSAIVYIDGPAVRTWHHFPPYISRG